jgi:hypothetical protein
MEFVATYAYIEAQLNLCICAITRGDPEMVGCIVSEVWNPRVLDTIVRRVTDRSHLDDSDKARVKKSLEYVGPLRSLRHKLCHSAFGGVYDEPGARGGAGVRSDCIALVAAAGFVDVVAGNIKDSADETRPNHRTVRSDRLVETWVRNEKAMRHEIKRAVHAHAMLAMVAGLAGATTPDEVAAARAELDRLLSSRP